MSNKPLFNTLWETLLWIGLLLVNCAACFDVLIWDMFRQSRCELFFPVVLQAYIQSSQIGPIWRSALIWNLNGLEFEAIRLGCSELSLWMDQENGTEGLLLLVD